MIQKLFKEQQQKIIKKTQQNQNQKPQVRKKKN